MSVEESLRTRVVRGAAWLYAQKLATGAIKLATIAILARSLTPGDFGLVVSAQVLLRITTIAGTGGIEEWIVAGNADDDPRKLSSAFWFNMLTGIALALVVYAASPLAVLVFHAEATALILALLLLQYLLEQLATVPEAIVMRSLDYRRLVTGDIVIALITAASAIGLLLAGWGMMSLVLPLILEAALRAIYLFALSEWRPALQPHPEHWRPIARFVMHVRGTRLSGTVSNDGDTLIVGNLLGPHLLGLYDMAFQTSTMVKRVFMNVVGRMSGPTLSSVDATRRAAVAIAGLRMTTLVTFPILMLLFILSGNLVLVLYGPQWGASVPPLRVFLLLAFLQAVLAPLSSMFTVAGRPELATKITVLTLPVFLLATVAGAMYWGMLGAAVGAVTARSLTVTLQLLAITRLLEVPALRVLAQSRDVLFFTLSLAALVLPVQLVLRHVVVTGPVVNLLSCGVIAVLGIILLHRTLFRNLAADWSNIIRDALIAVRRTDATVTGIDPPEKLPQPYLH